MREVVQKGRNKPMNPKPDRRSGLAGQSTVQRLVTQATEAQRETADQVAGRDGRGRPGNAGEKGRDRTGATKATYALPVKYQDLIRQVAEAEDVSQTDIVKLAAVIVYNARKAGRIDFESMKVAARSLKASWYLEVEDDFFLA